MKYKIVADKKEDECVFTDELFNSEEDARTNAENRVSELKMAVGNHIHIPYHIEEVEEKTKDDTEETSMGYRVYEVDFDKYNVEVDGGFNFEHLSWKNVATLMALIEQYGYTDMSDDVKEQEEPENWEEDDIDEYDYSCLYDYSICGREESYSYYDNAMGVR